MRIGFIGSGKVATAFGLYLRDKNQAVSGYYSRSNTSAASAAELVQTETFQTLEALIDQSDWIAITTPDDQIEGVALALSQLDMPVSKVFFHMSGAKSSACLYPLRSKGHHCLSLHPLQTIAEPEKGRQLLGQCFYAVEGDEDPALDGLLAALERPVVRISPQQKSYYHAAACVASNYLYTLAQEAIELMKLAGFEPQMGFDALKPLMEGTLTNLAGLTPAQALTGPIARGDVSTVREHLEALSEHEALLGVYKQMGLATLQLASLEKLKDPEALHALDTLLKAEEERDHEIN